MLSFLFGQIKTLGKLNSECLKAETFWEAFKWERLEYPSYGHIQRCGKKYYEFFGEGSTHRKK